MRNVILIASYVKTLRFSTRVAIKHNQDWRWKHFASKSNTPAEQKAFRSILLRNVRWPAHGKIDQIMSSGVSTVKTIWETKPQQVAICDLEGSSRRLAD